MGSSVILPPPGQPVEGPDPNFQQLSKTSLVQFLTTGIDPPSAFYVGLDDTLRLIVWNSVPNLAVLLNGRFMLTTGEIKPFSQLFTPTSDRTRNIFFLPMGEGFFLNITAQSTIPTANPLRGQTFCTVDILRGGLQNALRTAVLLSDYLVDGNALSWPISRILQSVESTGWVQSFRLANPAAGANFVITVPTNARWYPRSITCAFVTSAAVATRTVELNITDGTQNFLVIPPNVTQAAGLNFRYNGYPVGTAPTVDATQAFWQLPPDLRMAAGWQITSGTTNIQAGDQFSAIQLNVEEWIETH